MKNITEYNNRMQITTEQFDSFYKLIREALPAEESRSYDGQKELLKRDCYRLLLLTDDTDNEVTAALAVWEFEELRFVEHLAVSETLRGQGIGGKFLDYYKQLDDRPIVLEVELPDTEIARRRIQFYSRYGLILNEYEYRQLPLNEGDEAMPLYLMTFPKALDKQEFLKMKEILYRNVYGVTDMELYE